MMIMREEISEARRLLHIFKKEFGWFALIMRLVDDEADMTNMIRIYNCYNKNKEEEEMSAKCVKPKRKIRKRTK